MSALAYAAGKISVYSVIGALVILAGLKLEAASIPVIVVARKLLGPLMVLVGLGMVGAIRLRGAFGQRLSLRLRDALPTRGTAGAFLLGVVFSFAFCPTLFWLFFGLTVPLGLRSVGGWTFPGLFAVGSTLPLLVASSVVAVWFGAVERLAGGMSRMYRAAGVVAGGSSSSPASTTRSCTGGSDAEERNGILSGVRNRGLSPRRGQVWRDVLLAESCG